MATVTILAHRTGEAIARLQKLQRRAAKYGQAITWTETPRQVERVRPLWDGRKEKYMQAVVDFDVQGEAPRVGPYRFLAEIEHTPAGNLIAALGGAEIGALGREWAGGCEHCNSNRQRRLAYVVEHTETGERKLVGKSCLRDYTGHDTPAGAIAAFQWERAPLGDDVDEWGGGYSPWFESTRYVIAAARAAIALWGWRPKSADGLSTAGYVSLLWSVGQSREANRKEIDALQAEMRLRADEYVAVADAILAWGADLQPRGDYEHNLKIALANEYVGPKTFGLVVSACAAYDKQQAVVLERAERAKRQAEQAAASFHFGDAGVRYRGVQVTIDRTVGLPDNGFGPSVMFLMRTDDGAVLKWITGTHPRRFGKAVEAGDTFAADFTVKRHAEFNGTPQTVVNRLKAVG